ncbi:hypothetical protein SEA_TOMAS_79 [Streptomyces phage Tomas]|uniref:Uncharacterized protein n=1 Tax=Streptomyces phage Tomas TaxID=2914443 RepID=A0AA49BRV6_9CAUD|nr:hypothetical protein PP453_gp200 [Streptomyces phage Tomas]UMO76268.1 hypothetical protein SEA_TOMAS_79 [Streptomyces phage Tomas]
MNQRQQAHALISKYKKLYKEKYGVESNINSYSAQWGLIAALGDLKYATLQEVMDYYFTCDNNGHTIDNFLHKYTDLNRMRLAIIEDAIKRKKIMEETAERVKRMEERDGQHSGEAN